MTTNHPVDRLRPTAIGAGIGPVSRVRCGFCSRNVHESITALVPGQAAGNYRRQAQSRLRRVCRECVVSRVEFVRKAQADGLQVPLDESRVSWSRAAADLGIEVSDLWRNDYDRKRREEESRG